MSTIIRFSIDSSNDIQIDPPGASIDGSVPVGFENTTSNWDMSVEFGGSSPFQENDFYIDPGTTYTPTLGGTTGNYSYTVRATLVGDRDAAPRSKTADIEIQAPSGG